MRRILIKLCIIGGLFYSASLCAEPLVVIVHPDNPNTSISKRALVDLYLGRYVAFPNGDIAQPFDLGKETNRRKVFYESLTGRSISQINAYWSRIRFTGRSKMPTQLESNDEVIQAVLSNPNAIGYVSKSALTDKVKVIYEVTPAS